MDSDSTTQVGSQRDSGVMDDDEVYNRRRSAMYRRSSNMSQYVACEWWFISV